MNKVVNNALWVILGRIGQMAIQLVLLALTARYLGPSDFGLIHYVAAYTGFFAAFCGLGLPSTLVQELTRQPGKTGSILGTALGLQLLSGTLSAAAVWVLVLLAEGDVPNIRAVAAWSAMGLALRGFEVFRCWFQYRGQLRLAAAASLTAYGIVALFRGWLLVSGKSVVWFAFAGAAEAALSGVFLLGSYRGRGGAELRFSREMAGILLKRSGHFILPGILAAIYGQTDKLMLGRMLGDWEVGQYAAAVSISGGWCFVLGALIDAAFPEIMAAHQEDEDRFLRRNRQLYGGVFYLSAAVSAVLCLLADPLVESIYGEAYRPAGQILQMMTWHTAFSYLGVARNAWVVCRNAQRYLVWVYGSAAAGNIGLNLLLIPQWGAVGAAAASLVTQILTTLAVPMLIPALRKNVHLMAQAITLRGIREGKP